MKFGDYRAKMENEEKTLKLAEPKFTQKKLLEPKVFKKRVILSSSRSNSKCDLKPESSGFKFNFEVNDDANHSQAATSQDATKPDVKPIHSKITSGPYKSFHFQKSDNSFKFNFANPS